MSGIEAVGLVLALWPVVADLLKGGKIVKDRQLIAELIEEIDVCRCRFQQFTHRLLECDEDLSEPQRLLLSGETEAQDLASLWKNEELCRRIERRLGPDESAVTERIVARVEASLKTLEERIKNGDLNLESSSASLTRRARRRFSNALKVLPGSSLQNELTQIKRSIDMLDSVNRLSLYVESARHEPERPERPEHPGNRKRSQSLIDKGNQFFDDFYEAVANGYQCQCAAPHTINLRTYVLTYFEILFATDGVDRTASMQSFVDETCDALERVSMQRQYSNETLSTKSCVSRATWSKQSGSDSQDNPYGCRRTLSMCFSEVRPDAQNTTPIPDLCSLVNQSVSSPPNSPTGLRECEHVLVQGPRKYKAQLPRGEAGLASPPSVIGMDECLTSVKDGHRTALSRRHRLRLGLRLANAILHFQATRWLDESWTWENFSLVTEDARKKEPDLFLTSRFWSKESESQRQRPSSEAMSPIWSVVPEPLLVKLGFALIELALGKRLSELGGSVPVDAGADDGDLKGSDLRDYHTALRLVADGTIRESEGDQFHVVVQTCLTCTVILNDRAMSLNKRSPTFQNDMERYVTRPLKDYISSSWRDIDVGVG